MKKAGIFFTLVILLFHSGCNLGGVVSILGTATDSEKKIAAEYNLAERKGEKILVLVNQPAYLDAVVNLRFHLTELINKNLINKKKAKLSPEQLVSYSELSEFRSNRNDFSLLLPVEIGRALGADMVLLVMIEDYQLKQIAETDYYKGALNVQAVLIDTAGGEKLWPKAAKSKSIKVGFEIEDRGREVATVRLISYCTHCITRYLYNCPKIEFKIADDRSGPGWKDWKK